MEDRFCDECIHEKLPGDEGPCLGCFGTTCKPNWEPKNATLAPPSSSASPLDTQVGGGHYKKFKIQPAEFIDKNGIPFLEGCVIKRMCRHYHGPKRTKTQASQGSPSVWSHAVEDNV